MEAESFKKVSPKIFYESFLEKSVRPDGREMNDCRSILVAPGNINTSQGSCIVRIGQTAMICGLKLEPVKHSGEINETGNIDVSVMLSPLCSTKFNVGKPSAESVALSQYLHDLCVNSLIDLSDLVIIPKKYVWTLHADLICLDYDGNAIDTATYALYGALKTLQIPKVEENVDGELIFDYDHCSQLALMNKIHSQTFGFFNQYIISDPTSFEEDIMTDRVTIVLGFDNKILTICKPGNEVLEVEDIKDLITSMKKKNNEIFSLFDKLDTLHSKEE
ncbi:hypothetical protein WA158_007958 [Blastocystis sp. Blastoise]